MSSLNSTAEIKCGVYDIGMPSRAITAVHNTAGGDKQSYFIVGSCDASSSGGKTRNQITLLSYGEEKTFVKCVGIAPFSSIGGEIYSLATPGSAAATDDIKDSSTTTNSGGKLFSATHASSSSSSSVTSSICCLKGGGSGGEDISVERVCTLPAGTSFVAWNPLKINSSEVRVSLSATNEVGFADYAAAPSSSGEAPIISKYSLSSKGTASFSDNNNNPLINPIVLSWDPIYNDRLVAARGNHIFMVDARANNGGGKGGTAPINNNNNSSSSSSPSTSLLCSTAHGFGTIRSVHHNRNEINLIVTAADDGFVSFWDVRKAGSGPLMSHRLHDHWTQKVSFNRMSDRTFLTCSSDRSAKVWHLGNGPVPWGAAAAASLFSPQQPLSSSSAGGGADPSASLDASYQRLNNTNTSASLSASRGGGGAESLGSSMRAASASNNNNNNNNNSSTGLSGTSLGDFSDAVMDCCWSALTPFVTGAVAYNGKVILGTVSKATRDAVYGI